MTVGDHSRRLIASPFHAAIVLGIVALVSAGCSTESTFRTSSAVRFEAPQNRAEVTLPLTLRWSATLPAEAKSFLVVVDRATLPPGEGTADFLDDIDACDGPGRAECEKPSYLAEFGIYAVSGNELELPVLPARSLISKSERDRHQATIVLLDERGRRIDEQAWVLHFNAHAEVQ